MIERRPSAYYTEKKLAKIKYDGASFEPIESFEALTSAGGGSSVLHQPPPRGMPFVGLTFS